MNFHPPFSEPPSFSLFLIPQILTSNTSTRLWFYYIITKIHPSFQNPGSAPGMYIGVDTTRTYSMYISVFLSMYFFVLSNLNKDIKPFFYNKLLLLILSLSRLIFTGFKRPLTDSDLWALNKKNRASTIVPPFIKKWQEAESATRY